MTLLVPFDGSPLSETALERAVRFGDLTNEELLAVTVIPPEPSLSGPRDTQYLGDNPFLAGASSG